MVLEVVEEEAEEAEEVSIEKGSKTVSSVVITYMEGIPYDCLDRNKESSVGITCCRNSFRGASSSSPYYL